MLGAELVEEIAAADAEFCFEGVGWVVEASVDDLVAIEWLSGQITLGFGEYMSASGTEGPHLGVAATRLGSRCIVSLK